MLRSNLLHYTLLLDQKVNVFACVWLCSTYVAMLKKRCVTINTVLDTSAYILALLCFEGRGGDGWKCCKRNVLALGSTTFSSDHEEIIPILCSGA